MRLQRDLGVALRRQITQAVPQVAVPPARQVHVVGERAPQQISRQPVYMLLHQLVEAVALPHPLFVCQRLLHFRRRIAQPLDVAQLKAAGAIGVILQTALREGEVSVEAHASDPSLAPFPTKCAAPAAAWLRSPGRGPYSRLMVKALRARVMPT